jgi:hypothetical protein
LRFERGHQLERDLEREPRFPRPARAGDGDETRAVPKQPEQLGALAGPADEGGGWAGQIRVRDRLQLRVRDRLQRRETQEPELEQRNRLVEVLQAVLAQLGQLGTDERPRRRRHDDLAAVARGGNSRSAVELAPGVALTGQLQLASVQAQPHP